MSRVPGTRRRQEGQVLVGLPVIADDLDEDVKNALALRNATWVDGVCPSCGATPELAAYVALNLIGVVFRHTTDCPVSDLLDPAEAS